MSLAWPHLRDLELADPEFLATNEIDILLDADVYAAILGLGVRKEGLRESMAQQICATNIDAWIISRAMGILTSHSTSATNFKIMYHLFTFMISRLFYNNIVHNEKLMIVYCSIL